MHGYGEMIPLPTEAILTGRLPDKMIVWQMSCFLSITYIWFFHHFKNRVKLWAYSKIKVKIQTLI